MGFFKPDRPEDIREGYLLELNAVAYQLRIYKAEGKELREVYTSIEVSEKDAVANANRFMESTR